MSQYSITWINFQYLWLGLILIWPSWTTVTASMLDAFKRSYPKTFCIIDATELRCQTPSSLSTQSKIYSTYKTHTTQKGRVGIAPNGAFTFISELYSGAISDGQLVMECGFLNILESAPPGCGKMADRGLEIQDLLVPYNILLSTPASRWVWLM